MTQHGELLLQVEHLAADAPDTKTLMQRLADHVHSVLPRYNSVSFRFVDDANPEMLILGPHTASFTPQLRIAFEKGLCGAAAISGKTVVVNNVAGDSRYLAASSIVKSEIVVPIFVRGKLSAELDVQSYFVDTFKAPQDCSFVESCARVVERFMEAHSKKA
jgi:L-methionine (R)-S-oxide reductase